MKQPRVTLTGDVSGHYVVEEQCPDGRLVLRPDLSVSAILARHGERELTPAEFDRHFGHLPANGEGLTVADKPRRAGRVRPSR